jgi:hypothetical protein
MSVDKLRLSAFRTSSKQSLRMIDIRSMSGNVHGPGTLARDLLPCSELGSVGFDDRTREGRQWSPAEPIPQAGVGVSAIEGFSAVVEIESLTRRFGSFTGLHLRMRYCAGSTWVA